MRPAVSCWSTLLALALACAPTEEPEPIARDAATTDDVGGDIPARPGVDARVVPLRDAATAPDAVVDSATPDAPDAAAPVSSDVPAPLRELGVRSLFPQAGASGVCADPPLRIGFSSPPRLGNTGKLQVFDAAQPSRAVASLDLAAATTSITRGGVAFASERPAYVDGNEAVFYLPALAHGHRYFVHIDAGVVNGVQLDDDTTWTFSTGAAPAGKSTARVAYDGSGDFCSPQAALDALSSGVITIARGNYHGIVYFKGKRDLTIRGEERKGTVLLGTNNEKQNGGTVKRALIGGDGNSGLTIENLTIHNLTPQGGSQAEALRLEKCDRCIVRDADIVSLQDTLLWSGRLYAENSYIAGNVDFIWGTGAAFFDHCEIKTIGRNGYNVQARNGANGYGYVFVDSRLTSDPGISGTVLARIDSAVYPASHVALIDCELGSHIDPRGWLITGGGTSAIRFWEYGSKTATGEAVDVTRRAAGSTQLSASEAARMRDPQLVLGGWSPN